MGALDWFPETWNYTKFVQFLVKFADFVAIWPNSFLSGEFRVFAEMVIIWSSPRVSRLFERINSLLENFVFFAENDHYWLWALPWKFGSKIRFDRTKFILFVVKVTDWVVSLGEMV